MGRGQRGCVLLRPRHGLCGFLVLQAEIFPAIAGDGHGKVWISNLDEGLFYSTPEGIVQHIPWRRFGHQQGAAALLPDRLHGGLWLGFLDGGMAYLKDPQNSSSNVAEWLRDASVSDLQLGSDGAVWAATESGLSRVENGRVMTLTSKNGLPCDAVNWVIEDNDRSLWLYMACGLVRIARSEVDAWVQDPKRSIETTVFDSSDGVRSRALPGHYGRKVTKSSDGKIWFSAPDAVSYIDPRHLPFNKLPPPVDIERITADRKHCTMSTRRLAPAAARARSLDRLHGAEPRGAGKSSLPLQAGGAGPGLARGHQQSPGAILEPRAGQVHVPRYGVQ